MARILGQQDDFANQPTMLETVIRAAGHEIVFLPKFHCELNPIEMVSTPSHHVILRLNEPHLVLGVV